ncbi:hypothetical protein OS493_002079 [Desmophyllum pertusum]|uniref:Uncharacterized protein n=1 Tax=Desmophyllum pertusum TaxID=174260 RepID=A0A9X0CV21_9CNID|nr:hypothetical protein OS493_002079 [Desmophyllum pertusum]
MRYSRDVSKSLGVVLERSLEQNYWIELLTFNGTKEHRIACVVKKTHKRNLVKVVYTGLVFYNKRRIHYKACNPLKEFDNNVSGYIKRIDTFFLGVMQPRTQSLFI